MSEQEAATREDEPEQEREEENPTEELVTYHPDEGVPDNLIFGKRLDSSGR